MNNTTSNIDNFRKWYKDILCHLYPNRDAGFAILFIAFPLIERYLRAKSGISEDAKLNNRFYSELIGIFPVLENENTARDFWQIYRNGLLHQVTFSLRKNQGIKLVVGWVSNDASMLSILDDGGFMVHPAKFARHIVRHIENDFSTFEGQRITSPPLPEVQRFGTDMLGTSVPNSYIKELSEKINKKKG